MTRIGILGIIGSVYGQITVIDDIGLNDTQRTEMERSMGEQYHDDVKIIPRENTNGSQSPTSAVSSPRTQTPYSIIQDTPTSYSGIAPAEDVLPVVKVDPKTFTMPKPVDPVALVANPTQQSEEPFKNRFYFKEEPQTKQFQRPHSHHKKHHHHHKKEKDDISSDSSSSSSSSSEEEKPKKEKKKPETKPKKAPKFHTISRFILPTKDKKETPQKREFNLRSRDLKTKWSREYNEKLRGANDAKHNYLGVKITDSAHLTMDIEKDYNKLKRIEEVLEEKNNRFTALKDNTDQILVRIQAEIHNIEKFMEENSKDFTDVKAKIRMTQNEIASLYERLQAEKENLRKFLEELQNIRERENKYQRQKDASVRKINLNQDRRSEFARLESKTEKNLRTVRDKIRELEQQMSKEESYQSKLKIEKDNPHEDDDLKLVIASF